MLTPRASLTFPVHGDVSSIFCFGIVDWYMGGIFTSVLPPLRLRLIIQGNDKIKKKKMLLTV
jgi:hypothetical protein